MDAQFYDAYWASEVAAPDRDPTTEQRKKKLATALGDLSNGARVLDLGCGRGGFTSFLTTAGWEATGVDVSQLAIESARQLHTGVKFERLKDDGRIPFDDGCFDAVWSTEVIEHVFDIHEHLTEINRVLKDGGMYVLTTPYHGYVKNLLICLLKFDRHFDPEVSHIRFFDKAGLNRCLTRAGFQPICWSGVGRVPGLYRSWFVVAKKIKLPGAPPRVRG